VHGHDLPDRRGILADNLSTVGWVGAVGGLLWLAALTFEYAFDLFPPSSGTAFVSDQLVFAVAICCYIVLLLGWRDAGATGSSRGGRGFLLVWTVAWSMVLLGLLGSLLWPDLPLFEALPAVGGLLGAVCGVGTGILVARAGAFHGWPRWVPLTLGCYVVLVLIGPAVAGLEPTMVTEGLWALVYVALGAALRAATASPSLG
jgi:hypothetical protein